MIRAVLDTNVIVSAHLNSQGPPALILDLAFGRFFRCFVSEPLLLEYELVLRRPAFGISTRQVVNSIRALRRIATLVAPRRQLRTTNDPDDNKFLECALEARADYFVTGNIRHFPRQFQDIRIIVPRRFLTVLASNPS
jgi:hypothetical protein